MSDRKNWYNINLARVSSQFLKIEQNLDAAKIIDKGSQMIGENAIMLQKETSVIQNMPHFVDTPLQIATRYHALQSFDSKQITQKDQVLITGIADFC